MIYRIAKPADASVLADIHHRIKNVNENGIFVLMGKSFLRQYYKLVLSDPCSVCLCAEESGQVRGYTFSILDNERHRQYLMKHQVRLICSAIGSILVNPVLVKKLIQRYRSLRKNDGMFIVQSKVRGGYWGWDPNYPDSISSYELHNNELRILHWLGVDKLDFEVDIVNTHVYKFHKLNGAIVNKVITLPDGRERALMSYDLTKPIKY